MKKMLREILARLQLGGAVAFRYFPQGSNRGRDGPQVPMESGLFGLEVAKILVSREMLSPPAMFPRPGDEPGQVVRFSGAERVTAPATSAILRRRARADWGDRWAFREDAFESG